MKKLFALVALVLGVVSCQKDHAGMDVNMGGEQEVMINVSLPEETRANSAVGAFGNVDFTKYDVRFQCEVHYGDKVKVLPVQISDNGTTAKFPVRLIANRNYTFVVWADLVEQGETTDLHYNTANGLTNITLNDTWVAMDETRDAFTCSVVREFTRNPNINLDLTRPFAKLRVITTDMKELMGVMPTTAKVQYTTTHYEGFNALNQTPVEKSLNKTHEFTIAAYDDNTETDMVLFTDYFFAQEGDIVNFAMNVYDNDSVVIDEQKNFNTPIPAKRNYVTTIKGNILTYADDFNVTIDDVFDNAGNLEDIPYYYAAVTNGADLLKAISEGREIIALNDITVTAADANFKEAIATRAGEQPINAVINLNGFTITIENENADALVNLNGGTLTVEGEGAIESTAGALVKGTTVVTEGATVEAEVAVDKNGNSAVKSGLEALVYICENGGEFTFTEDLEATDVIFIKTTKPIVINGNYKTITSSASRVFRIIAKANVTINNLNIVSTTAKGNYDSVRGISMDGEIDDIVLTLNNCSVDFTADTAHDYSYAINKVGETSKNVQITINGGTYEGANVVNIWGNENIITINGATFNNLYRANEYYCGCCIRLEGSGNIVNIDNTTFTGAHASVVNEKTPGANTVNYGENNNTENLKRYRIKAGSELYYTLKDAVAATTEGEIKVLANAEMTEKVTIATGKNITLDLNGRTISGKTSGATNPQDLFLVKGNLTVKDGTITAEHIGANMGWGGQGTIFNITAGGVVTLNGVTAKHLGGTDMNFVAHLNNWGEVTLNVENSTLESNYVAVRVFNSGPDKNNVTIKNSTLKGGSYAFWVHNYTAADFGSEATAEAQKALLNFDIFNGTNTFIGKNETPIRYGMNNAIYTEASAIVSTSEELIAALNKNASVVNLLAGNYEMPQVELKGKSLTIKGSKDVVIDASKIDARNQFVTDATLAFEGVTINFGKDLYMGFANTASLKYKNCHINGLQFLFGENVEFENCTFNSNGAEHSVWTYGVKNVSFTDCVFTYGDRCVNCYSDNDVVGGKQTANFTNCTFTTENTASDGAVEINSCFFSVGIEVNLDDCTAPAYGQMAWVSRWDSTNGAKTTINIK